MPMVSRELYTLDLKTHIILRIALRKDGIKT